MYTSHKHLPTAVNIEKELQVSKRSIQTSILHDHAFYEIELVVSGKGVCNLNGQQLDMTRGFLCVNSPLDFHSITAHEDSCIDLINFTFNDSTMPSPEFAQFTKSALQKHLVLSEDELQKVIQLSTLIIEEPVRAVPYDIRKTCFEAIAKIILRNAPRSQPEQLGPICSVINYIQEHFTENLSIEDMAQLANFSVPYFSKCFKEKTGTNYKTYCSSVRIAYAMKLFATSTLNATEVCYRSGFNTYSVFARTFKQQTGMTPKAYVDAIVARKNKKENRI